LCVEIRISTDGVALHPSMQHFVPPQFAPKYASNMHLHGLEELGLTASMKATLDILSMCIRIVY
jgi:hypothetical protein